MDLREEQKIPNGTWNTWLILAGRGFGKTVAGAHAVIEYILRGYKLIALINNSLINILETMIRGPSGILQALKSTNLAAKMYLNTKKMIFSNGACCIFLSGHKPDNLRGYQFDLVWIDEFCRLKEPEQIFRQIQLCLRLSNSKLIITTTPKDIPILQEIINKDDTFITTGDSFQNKENLSSSFLNAANDLKNTAFGLQEVDGKIINQTLWTKKDILYKSSEIISRYRIGIDPAIGPGVTGIILCGITSQDEIIVLDDYSSVSFPEYWIEQLKLLVNNYKPMEISVEINQGGNFIEHLLHIHKILCPVIFQRAIKSKHERNLTTYLMYKACQIFHAKSLDRLEEEMLQNPKDRVDALTWAVYKFSFKKTIDICFV